MFGIKDEKVIPTELLVGLLCVSTTWTAKKKSDNRSREKPENGQEMPWWGVHIYI